MVLLWMVSLLFFSSIVTVEYGHTEKKQCSLYLKRGQNERYKESHCEEQFKPKQICNWQGKDGLPIFCKENEKPDVEILSQPDTFKI